MRSQDIRERYLRFFEERHHLRVASASLIPHDDPSLLFTVAGMVPFKAYLSGQKEPPSRRLASAQKCFRGSGLHDDITEVGDTSHHTFFEMLGNWSIGDYFKRDAIVWAWELLTKDFGLDPERLWPSIYPDDSESLALWTDVIGVPEARISRFEDNWWQAGPTGPCGYDSEIYWDFGGPCSCGADCRPDTECGGDRWLEIWNLVFMEFNQHEDGTRTALPSPCVDTGMGLERIATVLQGVRSDYDTDLFKPIVDGFRSRSQVRDLDEVRQRSFNVLADHLRGAAFIISDGVFPSNEGRGYVLRRVIRRAALHARRVAVAGGLAAGVSDLVEVMADVYPEIATNQAHVERVLREEEEAFARTIEAGAQRLDALVEGSGTISGDDAFRLYDTYGLPVELTTEIAAERGMTVDREGFTRAMEEQRDRSKAHAKRVGFDTGAALPVATFVGYERTSGAATVLTIADVDELAAGSEGVVVIDPTPFYAEAGGQIGDTGTLTWEGGRADVLDASYIGDARVLRVRVDRGTLTTGTAVDAEVNVERRNAIARHHSATHLLHKSLREVLGDSVVQRGSFVGPDHTTFDFAFSRALTPDEVIDVERRLNANIRNNHERDVALLPVAEARATGAMALFGEKYGDVVRVVDFGGWARELCGGTHVGHTGDIGAAIILSESSVGQGIRRIEMVAGEAAETYWRSTSGALRDVARQLKARPDEVPTRVAALQAQTRKLSRDLDDAKRSGGGSLGDVTVEDVGGHKLAHIVGDVAGDAVVGTVDRIFAERLGGAGIAVVVGTDALAVKLGADAVASGFRAGDLVRVGAEATGGRGGGRPDFARGAIKDRARRDDALAAIRIAVGGASN